MNCSLGSRFAKIIKRAGLTRWPRLFHALRASRETELAQEYPLPRRNGMAWQYPPDCDEALPYGDRRRL